MGSRRRLRLGLVIVVRPLACVCPRWYPCPARKNATERNGRVPFVPMRGLTEERNSLRHAVEYHLTPFSASTVATTTRETLNARSSREQSRSAEGVQEPTTGVARCCARAASGHVAVAPPTSVMNARRFIGSPRGRPGDPESRWARSGASDREDSTPSLGAGDCCTAGFQR